MPPAPFKTLKNSEQDWLKTNLAKFSRMLQGQKDLLKVGKLILVKAVLELASFERFSPMHETFLDSISSPKASRSCSTRDLMEDLR